MKFSLTTFFGVIGAVALAVAQVSGLSPTLHTVLVCISSACVAGLGYHATDKVPRPPLPPLAMFVALGAATLLFCAGCRVGGLAFKVTSTQFGTVGIALDGGVIGKASMPTNSSVPAVP